MDIQQLIDLDKLILMKLNGSDSIFWDGFMYIVTSTKTWIPAAVALLYVIFKNNKPRYILMNIEESPIIEMTDDEKIDFVAARILKQHKAAFLELAK